MVKESVWDTGERFAFTVGPDGLGSYWPVLYAVTRLRSSGRAFGTMLAKMRVIALFHTWAASSDIDLIERLQAFRFFSPSEVEALRTWLRRAGAGSRRSGATVSSAVWIDRCRIVAAYIDWHASFGLARLDRRDGTLGEVRERLKDCKRWLVADLPTPIMVEREGLTKEAQAAFLRAIVPGSETNPFSPRDQFRNFALTLLYCQLGLRLSEALNLKTHDLRLEGAAPILFVERRADDRDDPRTRQPCVKTKARPLPVARALALVLTQWVVHHRSDRKRYGNAKRNPYVFVSRLGRPLSKSSVEAIFRKLRTCDGVPGDFSAHVLRHTWNDTYSELASESEMRDAVEKQTRNFLMGWSDTSEQGVSYTRRATRDEADRLMLRLQEATVTGS